MKQQFSMFRRGEVFYCQDTTTGKQTSLRTKDESEAQTLLNAKNESFRQPVLNRQIARTYMAAADPQAAGRTWQVPMDEMTRTKSGATQDPCARAMQDKAFDHIRIVPILETNAGHFLKVLAAGGVATNDFFLRIHNFGLDMSWLAWPVLPRRQWPDVRFKDKRGITWSEHQSIFTREPNAEWRAFYSLLWDVGGSQTDMACLRAEDVDWMQRVISYTRKKTGTISHFSFGPEVEALLRTLPATGPLFPKLAPMHEKHRAKQFRRRCLGLKIKGVSLHSYRYAWAERARKAGYPERFAQEALGHNSKAVHRAYARKAQVVIPTLEEYEQKMAATAPHGDCPGGICSGVSPHHYAASSSGTEPPCGTPAGLAFFRAFFVCQCWLMVLVMHSRNKRPLLNSKIGTGM
ncbi:MAG: hypothetical protein EBU46_08700 [Nitrosomonadaceae bacterium]|nr:hypothetical protein [Nitrosomonadaceae bacterium]